MKVGFLVTVLALVISGCNSFYGSRDAQHTIAPSPPRSSEGDGLTASPYAAESLYTELSGGKCTQQRQTGIISSERECPGALNYKLRIATIDDRDDISVIAPNGKLLMQGYSNLICGASFGFVGQKAEWRVLEVNGHLKPIALIVRVNCQSMDSRPKMVSYLAVSKITDEEICVTDRVPPTQDANARARIIADSSTNKPCLASSNRDESNLVQEPTASPIPSMPLNEVAMERVKDEFSS